MVTWLISIVTGAACNRCARQGQYQRDISRLFHVHRHRVKWDEILFTYSGWRRKAINEILAPRSKPRVLIRALGALQGFGSLQCTG